MAYKPKKIRGLSLPVTLHNDRHPGGDGETVSGQPRQIPRLAGGARQDRKLLEQNGDLFGQLTVEAVAQQGLLDREVFVSVSLETSAASAIASIVTASKPCSSNSAHAVSAMRSRVCCRLRSRRPCSLIGHPSA
jgi:hypothetical protein